LAGAELAELVRPDFDAFLGVRAKMIAAAAAELTEGMQPELRDILSAVRDEHDV
jgi:hypothetical protein